MGRTIGLLLGSLLSGQLVLAQTLADVVGGCGGVAPERTINADPLTYRSLLGGLGPGDRLLLAAGTYTQGLPLVGLNGQPNRCIVIEGPAMGPRAVFTARDCCNTVSLTDSSYLAIRNLDIDGQNRSVDAVKAESPSISVHHVTLEGLTIRGHAASQQIVGINTKCRAWNWVVRRCRIERAGTGIYLGDSNGTAEFVNGLIEHNVILDSVGYNMQIKHQLGRDTTLGIPASARTIIRHNVLSKASGAATGGNARPNLLVGHWPLSGAGATDVYEIYGNLFHQNPTEALFQGEGNIAFHNNLLLNDTDPGFPAVAIQPHNDVPRAIEVFFNTIVAAGRGLRISGGAGGFQQRALANAVFANLPIQAPIRSENVEDVYAAAGSYLDDPTAPVGGGLSLFPRVGTLRGTVIGTTGLTTFRDYDRDFNGAPRGFDFRGAYAGEGINPGWSPELTIKPEPAALPTLTIDDRSVAEGSAANASFRVSLSAASAQAVSVDYATADGSAVAGGDYIARAGTLSLSPGRTTHSIFVPIVTDGVLEGTETFVVDLANASGAVLGRAQAIGTIGDPPLPTAVPMYRAYNPTADYHFFTTSLAEKDNAVVNGYRDENDPTPPFRVANSLQTGADPIHRMYNPNSGRHYYTASAGERDFLMAAGWIYEKDEGIIHAAAATGRVEVFRLYNTNSGVHLYTASASEKDAILALFAGIWQQHTSLGFGFPP